MTLSTRYIIDTGPKINTFGLELWKILIRKDENHIVVFDYEMKGFLIWGSCRANVTILISKPPAEYCTEFHNTG